MSSESLVKLDLSGTHYTIERSLLSNYSYFQKLFKTPPPNKKKRYFVNRSAKLFDIVVQFLRTSNLFIPPSSSLIEVQKELDYYGIIDIQQRKFLYSGSFAQSLNEILMPRLEEIVTDWTQKKILADTEHFESLSRQGVSSRTIMCHNCADFDDGCAKMEEVFDQQVARDLFTILLESEGFSVYWSAAHTKLSTSQHIKCWSQQNKTHSMTSRSGPTSFRTVTISWSTIPSNSKLVQKETLYEGSKAHSLYLKSHEKLKTIVQEYIDSTIIKLFESGDIIDYTFWVHNCNAFPNMISIFDQLEARSILSDSLSSIGFKVAWNEPEKSPIRIPCHSILNGHPQTTQSILRSFCISSFKQIETKEKTSSSPSSKKQRKK